MLVDRYQLERPIAKGIMSTVYTARDTKLDRPVAIKILNEPYSLDKKFVKRFQLEAKSWAVVQHPNVVRLYDYDNYYIVMELVYGPNLKRFMKQQVRLGIERSIAIAHDIAQGLIGIHQHELVHRAITPQNILIDDTARAMDFGITAKITDFGIVYIGERITEPGTTLGTVQYYSPEQAQGEAVSPASDIYSLGVVLYEMLCRQLPFEADSPVALAMMHISDKPRPPRELNSAISPELEDIVLKCLEKLPEQRYQFSTELEYALLRLIKGW